MRELPSADVGAEAITREISSLPEYISAKTVFAFVGIAPEPDTSGIILKTLSDGKALCLPRCLPDGGMEAVRIIDISQLEAGTFGIPEPSQDCEIIEKTFIDLIIVPGVAFDKSGGRLGRGRGFYDRYLTDFAGNTVGLCSKDRLVEKIPADVYDVPVEKVLAL